MNTVAAEEYCRNKAAPAGSSLYYSCLYLSPVQKRAMYALHSFGNEVAGILEECADPGVARLKFAWWQDELQHLYQQQPRHPVSHELQTLIVNFPLQQHCFASIIRHYEQRLNKATASLSFDELKSDMMSGPGELWRLSASANGTDPALIEMMGQIGSGFGIFDLLQQHPAVINADRIAIIQQLHAYLESACSQLTQDKSGITNCILIMARIIMTTCQEILRDEDLIHKQKISLTPLRKLWIAWRTHAIKQ